MAMDHIKEGKLLYHLTKLKNLESIIQNGLLSRKAVLKKRLSFQDVADKEIITKRTQLGLDKYVPFHFHPYTSFDIAVRNKYHQDDFIYITLKREYAKQNGFKILPQHPLSSVKVELFSYNEGFEKIDWNTMHELGTENEYKKNVKMAECLTDAIIPFNSFMSIYVKDETTKKFIERMIIQYEVKKDPPYINIQKNWFI